jgi:CheY-like chemotaxis protein
MPANLANRRILIVDDELTILELTSLILQPLGIGIQTARNPLVALDMVRLQSFDLIITDLWMPEMNGLEFARAVKAINPECKLVLLTGTPPRTVPEVFDAMVVKPFPAEQLKQVVSSLL